MQKKNRIRLSSGTDKLESRELLSGSQCCCSAPQVQASVADSSSSTAITDSSAVDYGVSSSNAIDDNAASTVDNLSVATGSETTGIECNVTTTPAPVQSSTSTAGITINNINQINGFNTSGGAGGQFSGNFQGEVNATSQQSNTVDSTIGSTREFNGNTYNLIKNKGNKYTYKNTTLRGGQRTVDLNPTTGAFKTHSPVALDLNGSGAIETTGASTAKQRVGGTAVGKTVAFDINGDGVREKIEWLSGSGDGLLVDDRDGRAAKSMNGNRLFGDANGQYSSGYEKLAKLDADGNGVLSGGELSGLKVWQDNGDAKVQAGEMKSLADLGVEQISVQRQNVSNARGETLMQSVAQRNGQSILTEDVWFGQA